VKIINFSPELEQRENQIKMAKKVYETFTFGQKSLIEAPTGI
jgi:Rad3-related DNA helicase